jgi:LytTr DNA-binding domain
MTAPATREAPNAGKRPLFEELCARENVRGYVVSLGVGLLLAISGAFSTAEVALLLRLAYWLPIMVIGAIIGSLVTWQVIGIDRWARSAVLAWAIVTSLVAIPMTFVVWAATTFMFWHEGLNIARIGYFVGPVTLISGLMAGVFTFLNQAPAETHAGPVGTPPRFLERLPAKLKGARLYAVEADDHYLRLHTSKGTDMILMRLVDAIDELEGIEGAQVHRSWWVARDAVQSVQRGEGKAVLTLSSGILAPVSRTYARALREAGWY